MNVIEQISHRRSNWFICRLQQRVRTNIYNLRLRFVGERWYFEYVFLIFFIFHIRNDTRISALLSITIFKWLSCNSFVFLLDFLFIFFSHLNKEKNVGIGKMKHSWHIRINMFMYELSVIILSCVNHRIYQEIVISKSQNDEFFYTF